MRKERDRFRLAVEDAHLECRRLAAQVQEFQSHLRHTQSALRDSKSMADAARHELERLRHWIDEAHAESRRLSTEVQDYEQDLKETRQTLEGAERSCFELKSENESKHAEIIELKQKVDLLQNLGDAEARRSRFNKLQHDVEEARHEAQAAQRQLYATLRELEEEKARTARLDEQLSKLQPVEVPEERKESEEVEEELDDALAICPEDGDGASLSLPELG